MLTAAEHCFDRFGIAKTTMEDIGRTAGVSRATVYRYFADREALLLASVIRRPRSDMPRGRRDPIVQLLVTSDQPALAARVLGGEGVSHQLSYELWEPVLAAAQQAGEMSQHWIAGWPPPGWPG